MSKFYKVSLGLDRTTNLTWATTSPCGAELLMEHRIERVNLFSYLYYKVRGRSIESILPITWEDILAIKMLYVKSIIMTLFLGLFISSGMEIPIPEEQEYITYEKGLINTDIIEVSYCEVTHSGEPVPLGGNTSSSKDKNNKTSIHYYSIY